MTIETEESVVLRGSPGLRSTLKWCPVCARQVEMVNPEQAAQIAGVTSRTIYRWVEADRVHFTEDCGRLLICVPALSVLTAAPDAAGPTVHTRGRER